MSQTVQNKKPTFSVGIQKILDEAKTRSKGNWSTYESLKNEIANTEPSQYEYMAACHALSSILKV